MLRASLAAASLAAVVVTSLPAQSAAPGTIDTIIVIAENVFGPEDPGLLRFANSLRISTRPSIVRRELLFDQGEVYDSALVAETERNLRQLGVFRFVSIDTARVDDRFAVVVRTADGWSTQLQMNFGFTGGLTTWSLGLTETNFLGTANAASAIFTKGVDRNSLTLSTRLNRLVGQTSFAGAYVNLSDGTRFLWSFGLPYRSFSDRRSIQLIGEVSDHQVREYVNPSAVVRDTARYQRRAVRNVLTASFAPVAGTRRYLRVGLSVQLRREDYVLRANLVPGIPDTISGAVGAFAEYRRARFTVGRYYNGFGRDEDIDLSSSIRIASWFAPEAFGYARTGVGPQISAGTGFALPFGYAQVGAAAQGLFTSVGLDSGQVAAAMTVGIKVIPKQVTFLHVQGGVQSSPAPGTQFDLGVNVGPRSFDAHAFTGTRAIWGTVEHRVFLWDDIAGLLGVGLAGFLDYGGAWYPSQPARAGGNIGVGIRLGTRRSSATNTGRIDFGYRFGDGWSGKRWVVSAGRALLF